MRHSLFIRKLVLVLLIVFVFAAEANAATYETIRPGHAGETVRAMQSGLQFLGFPLNIDGKYGKMTEAAVKAFQLKQNLLPDGLAGNKTLTELYRLAPQFEPKTQASGLGGDNLPGGIPVSGNARLASVYTANRGSLNLRNRPAYGNTTIAQLPFGLTVTVLGETGSWTQVSALGRTGYVLTSFLKSGLSETPAQTAPSGGQVATPQATPAPAQGNIPSGQARVSTANQKSLNMRSRASADGIVLVQIDHGALVDVLRRNGSWTQVRYGSRTGYVMDRFLKHASAVNTPVQSPAATPAPGLNKPAANVIGEAIVNNQTGRFLNFRSAPTMGDNIIGQIPSGTSLSLLLRGTDWCEVIYKEKAGYVMSSFLSFTARPDEPEPSPEPAPDESPVPDEPPVFTRTLRLGLKGADVKELQARLAALKYTVSISSSFDEMTEEAVMLFQQKNALTADGIFGSQSAQVLLGGSARLATDPELSYKTLRIDNNSEAVGTMQKALKALGYPLSVNNRYDIPTHQAVVSFQQRNGLPITGIANPLTQSRIFSDNAKGYSTPVSGLGDSEGKGGGPSVSQVKLLHWFKDIKPRFSGGQKILVYHPGSNTSFNIRFYSLGNHADSEPLTWRDTQLMNRSFGTPSWNVNTVYVKLPDGVWTLAAMHNRPHLTGAISDNGFGGHLCIHFLRDMDEVMRNDPDYGASNQRAIRKAWLSMTGETID